MEILIIVVQLNSSQAIIFLTRTFILSTDFRIVFDTYFLSWSYPHACQRLDQIAIMPFPTLRECTKPEKESGSNAFFLKK